MSVQFALARWAGDLESGPVNYVGLFSTSVVSRNGPPMKERQPKTIRGSPRMETTPPMFAHGDAPVATSRMRYFLPHTVAGVRRKWTHDPILVCLHIRVGRLARVLVRAARTHVMQLAMLGHVRLALQWGLPRTAFAAGTPQQSDVRTPITNTVGAAEKSAEISFHVVNTPALHHVMRGCVVHAMSKSTLVVIAVNCKPRCCAARRMRS